MTHAQRKNDGTYRYLIVGAGLQSHAIAHYLLGCPDTAGITVVDRDPQALVRIKDRFRTEGARVACMVEDASDIDRMYEIMQGHDGVASASSYKLNLGLTRAAIAAGVHFVDLGGNDSVVAKQFALDEDARAARCRILPDSGIAPGAASILARHALDNLPGARNVRIYCGGLPQDPTGPLMYAKFFAMSGLINEYKEDCRVIKDGKPQFVRGLDRAEKSLIEHPQLGTLESAYTSGGVSTLVDTYAGKLDNLSYETLRYCGDPGQPSHWDVMRMYRDNGWFEEGAPREALEAHLDRTLLRDVPDYLALIVEAEIPSDRMYRLTMCDKYDEATGLSAMQRTTGFSAAIELRMLVNGTVQGSGALKHEAHIPTQAFLDEWTRMGIATDRIIRVMRKANA